MAYQDDWIEVCQSIGDDPYGGQRDIIVAPPGWGKSEVIAVLFNAWMIGRHARDNFHLALLSYGNKPAFARSRAIRGLIKNEPTYRLVFPDIEPALPWGAGEFNVHRGRQGDSHPTMLCGGTRSAVVSFRINCLTLDDAIDQKQNANLDQREKAWENYVSAISTRLTKGAPQLNIGTRWGDDDFIAQLVKQGGWKLHHISAMTRRGRSSAPWAKTTRELLKIKHDMPELFQVQYLGDPGAKGIGIIKRVATYKEVPSQDLVKDLDLLVAASWDTALKQGQQHDYTVGYVGGLDPYRRIWILDRRKDRYTSPQLIDEITDVQEEWDPYYQWIEDTAQGTAAVQTVEREVLDLLPLEPVPVTAGGSRSRANALAPYFNSRRVILPKFAEWYEDSKYCLTRYPYIAHDDDIDAMYILVTKLLVLPHPSTFSRRGDYGLDMASPHRR